MWNFVTLHLNTEIQTTNCSLRDVISCSCKVGYRCKQVIWEGDLTFRGRFKTYLQSLPLRFVTEMNNQLQPIQMSKIKEKSCFLCVYGIYILSVGVKNWLFFGEKKTHFQVFKTEENGYWEMWPIHQPSRVNETVIVCHLLALVSGRHKMFFLIRIVAKLCGSICLLAVFLGNLILEGFVLI